MAAIARLRTLRKFLAPSWLTSGEGELLGYALDIVKDDFVDRVYRGLLARFPGGSILGLPADTAPEDALAALGRDRRVVRGIGESATSYAARLKTWLDDRKTAGNPFALMARLSEYVGPTTGASFRTVDARGNWYSRAADGTESYLLNQANWDWDGLFDGSNWAQFWVIIYPGTRWSAGPTWGTGTWGAAGQTWGSTATQGEVQTLRAIVADWKLAGSRCKNIIIAFDPSSFDPTAPEPDGTWGQWSDPGLVAQPPVRLATARYWDGV